jgi:hypothetical protein
VPIIKRFISGVEESGKYSGFCSLGISCQATENIQIRECFGMRPEMTGVLVSRINPISDAYNVLRKDDILLEFDGVPIANDGTGEPKTSQYALAAILCCQFFIPYMFVYLECINYLTFLFIILFKDCHLAYCVTCLCIADG